MRRRGLDSADSFDQVVQRVTHHKPATRVSQPRSLGGLLGRETLSPAAFLAVHDRVFDVHRRFVAMRDDKKPAEVVRET